MEAIDFDAIFDWFLTFRTNHLFGCFLEAGEMEIMMTGSNQERTKRPTDLALAVLILIFMPFDVILHDGEMFTIITTFHVLDAVPNYEGK